MLDIKSKKFPQKRFLEENFLEFVFFRFYFNSSNVFSIELEKSFRAINYFEFNQIWS